MGCEATTLDYLEANALNMHEMLAQTHDKLGWDNLLRVEFVDSSWKWLHLPFFSVPDDTRVLGGKVSEHVDAGNT